MTQTTPRYAVEPGTDGSRLFVDRGVDRAGRGVDRAGRGADRAGRRAVERLTDEPAAPEPDDGFDAVFVAALVHGQAVDAVDNFGHLLRPRP